MADETAIGATGERVLDAVYRVSPEGDVLDAHPVPGSRHPVAPADTIGRPLRELLRVDDALDEALGEVARTHVPTACGWQTDGRGEGAAAFWSAHLIPNGDDVVVAVRDVTEEHCRREADELLRDLTDELLHGESAQGSRAPSEDDVSAALRRVADLLGVPGLGIVEFDERTNRSRPLYTHTPGIPDVDVPRVAPYAPTWWARAAQEFSGPMLLDTHELPDDALALREWTSMLGLAAVGLVPLMREGATVGVAVVAFAEAPDAIQRAHFGALGGLGNLLSAVVERTRRADAARDSAVLLEALVEQSHELIAVFGADGHIRYLSPRAARAAGFGDDYRTEEDPRLRVIEADRPPLTAAFGESVAAPRSPVPVSFRAWGADGRVVSLEGTFTNLLDVPGVEGIVLNAHDVSEQQASARALERRAELDALTAAISRDLLGASPDAVEASITDALGRIARMVGADGAALRRRDDDGWFRRVCEWHDAELGPLPADSPERYPPTAFPRLLDAMAQGRSGLLERVDDLPQQYSDERRMLELIGARSAALVSVTESDGDAKAFVSIYWRADATDKQSEDLGSLRVISDVLVSAYDRAVAERARVATEARQRLADARIRSLIEHSTDGILVFGAEGGVEFASPSVEQIYGRPVSDFEGGVPRTIIHPDDVAKADAAAEALMDRPGTSIAWEGRIRRPDGQWRWLESTMTNLLDSEVEAVVVNVRDISERKQFEQDLEHQALHDALTGLPNRALLIDRLEQALARAARGGASVGLLFLDLDRFKYVNDSHGHGTGDQLLQLVAERLRSTVRPSDTVARFGGDEFVVLVEDDAAAQALVGVAERIRSSLHVPFAADEIETFVTASIGIAASLPGQHDAETLLRDADAAMYRAKEGGRDRCEVFDPSIHDRAVAHLATTNALRSAIDEGRLCLHYQPLVRITTGEIVAFESLLRWELPDGSLRLPDEFVPVAEDTGLIVPMGAWVIDEACRQAAGWTGISGRGRDLPCTVNLSVRQLREPGFNASVEEAITRHGVDPSRIVFELTESVAADEATLDTMKALRALGVMLVIDDFGTGYSSLAYLKQLPIVAVKIDRAFVDGLGTEQEDTEIVNAILGLARGLQLNVVAEGVESMQQLEELRALRCDYAQGFLFGEPAPASHWGESLRRGRLEPRAVGSQPTEDR